MPLSAQTLRRASSRPRAGTGATYAFSSVFREQSPELTHAVVSFIQGMFCILIPATLAPVIGTLLWAQIRAKRLGLSATNFDEQQGGAIAAAKDRRSFGSKLLSWAIDIDALGLILFGAGWACILLPLTLTNKNTLTWSSYKIIILFVIGGCTLLGFLAYERFLAKKPLFPFRFFKSYTVVACAVIPLLDFISFCASLKSSHELSLGARLVTDADRRRPLTDLQFTYQYSFISVTKGWSIKDQVSSSSCCHPAPCPSAALTTHSALFSAVRHRDTLATPRYGTAQSSVGTAKTETDRIPLFPTDPLAYSVRHLCRLLAALLPPGQGEQASPYPCCFPKNWLCLTAGPLVCSGCSSSASSSAFSASGS